MSKREMTVICPTIVETKLTGFLGASERQLYGKTWRVEWWNGKEAIIKRDGTVLTVKDIPAGYIKSVRNLLVDSHKFFTRALELQAKVEAKQ